MLDPVVPAYLIVVAAMAVPLLVDGWIRHRRH
jgi:hypothetical protein